MMFNKHALVALLMLVCCAASLHCMERSSRRHASKRLKLDITKIDQNKMDLVRRKGLTWYLTSRMGQQVFPDEWIIDKIINYIKPVLTDEHKKFLLSTIDVPCVIRFKDFEDANAVAFNHDGNQFAAKARGIIKIWNLQTGKCSKTFKVGKRIVNSLTFSHNGKQLAIGGFAIQVWDLQIRGLLMLPYSVLTIINLRSLRIQL